MNRVRQFPEDITAATVAWLELRDQGQFEGEREEKFLAWLEADPRHLEAFEEYDRVWSGLGRLQPRPLALVPALAATAPAASVRPGVPRLYRIGRPVIGAAVLATAAAVALGFFLFPRVETGAAEPLRSAATQPGEEKIIHLSDGSLIRLDSGTRVDIDYMVAERRLRLAQGSARFAVAKNKSRPFIVSAGTVSVRAVGTAFEVRLAATAVEVAVTEGRVRVDDAASGASLLPKDTPVVAAFAGPVLEAGHKVVIPTDQTLGPVSEILALGPTPAAGPAPQPAMLEFDGAPLEQVVAEFNRHNRHQLVITDDRLRGQQFTGKFRSDGYEGLIRLLESSFGIQAEERGGETRLRLAGGDAAAR